MANLPDDFAPYAPVGNVLMLIHRFRERGLPNPLTTAELERLTIPEGNLGRVSQTLRFLELIDEEAKRTEKFEVLGKASTEQYPQALKQIIEVAYRAVLTYVNPAVDSELAVADQFRHFKPESVRPRMVALFYGLCQEAGIVPEGTVPRPSPPRNPSSRTTSNGERQKQPATTATEKQSGGSNVRPDDSGNEGFQQKSSDGTGQTSKYQLLQVLLGQLPAEGNWTQKRRDLWIQALTANLDVLVEINEPEQ